MKRDEILKNQGFSDEEIAEMQPMTSAVSYFFSEKTATVNWSGVAVLEADMLTQTAKSKKVKDFALQIWNKLKQFS